MKTHGVTLIELLVTMAILGIVLTAILALQSSAISVTSNVMSSGRSLEEQNATMNYVADRFRGSLDWPLPATLTLSGSGSTAVTCAPGGTDKSCVAFVTPETTYNDASGRITRYVVLAYTIEKRTTFTDRRPDAWADAQNLMVVREYRQVLTCGATCSKPLSGSVSVGTAWASAVVGDGFTRVDAADTFELTGNKLVLSMKSAYSHDGNVKYLPVRETAKLTVYRRN